MPRRNYDKRNGRPRPQPPGNTWDWLVDLLAADRRYRAAPHRLPATSAGEQRTAHDRH